MRLHINLKNRTTSRMWASHFILAVADKVEWPQYHHDPDKLNPWKERCRWCRYRMEGGGGPQHNLQNDEAQR